MLAESFCGCKGLQFGAKAVSCGGHLVSCIVGLNDAEDEQNQWVRVTKDVADVIGAGQRSSAAANVLRNRVNNHTSEDDVKERPLLGHASPRIQAPTGRLMPQVKCVARQKGDSFKLDLPSLWSRRRMSHLLCSKQRRGEWHFRICFHGVMAFLS